MTQSALRRWAKALKANIHAVYLASRDPRVPLVAKIIISMVVAYALSPIDLIPDFIPILGYLDDLLLLPMGIWLAVRLIPPEVWKECLALAAAQPVQLTRSWRAALVVVIIWLVAVAAFGLWIWRMAGTVA